MRPPDIDETRDIMQELRIRRATRWAAALLVSLAAAACSTQNVTLKATVGPHLNPNFDGGQGILDVYAFFLKKPDAFQAGDKRLSDFLVDSVRATGGERKPPAWLEADTVAVELMQIAPVDGDAWPVAEKRFEVPVGSTGVGLVAAFQGYEDGDSDWRLWVPVSGGTVAFRVAGKKLELPVALPTKAAASTPSQPKKEAPRAGSTDR